MAKSAVVQVVQVVPLQNNKALSSPLQLSVRGTRSMQGKVSSKQEYTPDMGTLFTEGGHYSPVNNVPPDSIH